MWDLATLAPLAVRPQPPGRPVRALVAASAGGGPVEVWAAVGGEVVAWYGGGGEGGEAEAEANGY